MDRIELPEPRCQVRTITTERWPMSPPPGAVDVDSGGLSYHDHAALMRSAAQHRALEPRWSNFKASLFHPGSRSAQH